MGFKKEDEVLRAALNEFSSKSYDESSLNSIINASGISKGSFYHHFKNKYDMYLYVLKDSVNKKWKYINDNSNLDPKDNIFDLLEFQINIGNNFSKDFPIYASLYNMFIKEKNSEIYARVIKDLGVDEEKGLNLLIDKSFEERQFKEIYSKEFIKNIMCFFFKSYNELVVTDESTKLLIEFLKNGLKR